MTPGALDCGSYDCPNQGITAGSDGNIWFTEPSLHNSNGTIVGGVARLNLGFANVTEFPADTTPGFSTQAQPWSITSGTGGHVWFTEFGQLGGVAFVNGDGTIHEYGPPATPGFTAEHAAERDRTGQRREHVVHRERRSGGGRAGESRTGA